MTIENLSTFHKDWLRLYGRTDLVENPAGKFRERLVFVVAYWAGGANDTYKATFTFTSKNAPPFIEYKMDGALINEVINPLYHTFSKPYQGSTTEPTEKYYTRTLFLGRNFRVNIDQPPGALHDEITENVLTKKDTLYPGFTLTPLWHPTENRFEAPLSYGDEHSTFFLEPEEKKFTPVRIFDGYYPVYEVGLKYDDIPILVDRPIEKWPPDDILFEDDMVIDNPWEWNKEGLRINDNYSMILPTADTFTFGETVFDTGGKNPDTINITF
jgi:hypothetical protein